MHRYSQRFSQPFPSRVIREFDRQVRPNIFAVGHLHRALWDPDLRLGQTATFEIYDLEAYKLMANLTKRLLGKTAYRKRPLSRKRLPNFVTLECQHDRPHLNMLIHKSERWSFEEFEAALKEEWMQLDWSVKDPDALWAAERTGDCVAYAFKEGNESLLPRSFCFHR